MRTLLLWTVLAALCRAQTGSIEKLSFLSGCWAGGGTEEVWLKPQGGTMLGMSRTIKGDKTVFTEFLQISAGSDGVLVLNAQLKLADKSTQFRLAELKDGMAAFSNPAHDYPQRIIYRREPDGSLFARIEGKAGGKDRHDDFRYARVPC
jgi:hypothetical protein